LSVLADRDIRAEIESGRVRIEPYDPADLQPSSVDLHLDRSFRVFRNNRYPYIDVRQLQPDLTELLTIVANEFGEERAWFGDLHLIALYGRALTSAEISQNYNAGP